MTAARLQDPEPAVERFLLRFRWGMLICALVLIVLSPYRTTPLIYGVLVGYTAVTTLLHLRLRRQPDSRDLSPWYLVLLLDVAAVSIAVYGRDGLRSDIYNLYYLAIIQAAILRGPALAVLSGAVSAAAYGLAVLSLGGDTGDLRRVAIRAIYFCVLGVLVGYLSRLEKRALLMALTDFKTQLPNFRAFHHQLTDLVAAAQRNGKLLAVAILDVDNFRELNARIGHPNADNVLEQLAALLLRKRPEGAVLARYGGEEFVMYVPDATGAGALAAAEAMRQAVAQTAFLYRGDATPVRITLSAGVAAFPADGETVHELLVAADQALLRAKASGKNRCLLAGPPPPEPRNGSRTAG